MIYIPDRCDIIWIEFNPQMGHEQGKRRPALVLSPKEYNRKTSLCLVCPMTSKKKGYSFEVATQSGSVILADHVKSLDWRARKASFKEKATLDIVDEVVAKLSVLLKE